MDSSFCNVVLAFMYFIVIRSMKIEATRNTPCNPLAFKNESGTHDEAVWFETRTHYITRNSSYSTVIEIKNLPSDHETFQSRKDSTFLSTNSLVKFTNSISVNEVRSSHDMIREKCSFKRRQGRRNLKLFEGFKRKLTEVCACRLH